MAVFSIEEIMDTSKTDKENINRLKKAVQTNTKEIHDLELNIKRKKDKQQVKHVLGGGYKITRSFF